MFGSMSPTRGAAYLQRPAAYGSESAPASDHCEVAETRWRAIRPSTPAALIKTHACHLLQRCEDLRLPCSSVNARPIENIKHVVCESGYVEACMEWIEAAPNDDDFCRRHYDRVLAAAAIHPECP